MDGTRNRVFGSDQGNGIWQTDEFVFGVTGGLAGHPRRQRPGGLAATPASPEIRQRPSVADLLTGMAQSLAGLTAVLARADRQLRPRLGGTRRILWPSAIVRWAWRNPRLRRAIQIEGWHRNGSSIQERQGQPSPN